MGHAEQTDNNINGPPVFKNVRKKTQIHIVVFRCRALGAGTEQNGFIDWHGISHIGHIVVYGYQEGWQIGV
jgi:hypothetical protein